MKSILKSTLVVALAGAATWAAIYAVPQGVEGQRGGGRGARARADGPVPVVAVQVRTADVPVYLDGVGSAKARNSVIVRPQVDGKILSINFKEGQDVKKGDVLAQIDPVTYQAQLDQALAKKALDESQLANAKLDLERYGKLASNIVAQKTVDTQRATVAQLEAQIKSDEAAISSARAFLGYTTVVAPIDGRIGLRQVDEGNLVRASDAGIATITEIRPISVLFTLPQQQLKDINAAMALGPVPVAALETGGKTVIDTGTIQVVDNQVDQATGTIRIKADFPNEHLQLWPGQFVNARVQVKTLQNVLVVPSQAVQRGPQGEFAYVVQSDNKVALRPVEVSLQNDTDTVIGKGLEATDRVVTVGFARLQDGASVEISQSGDGTKPLVSSQVEAGTESETDTRAALEESESSSKASTSAPADAARAADDRAAHVKRGRHRKDANAGGASP